MDKISLLRAGETFHQFPDNDLVRAEMPAFCAYLRDLWGSPDMAELCVGGRFGVAAYHDPALLDEARVTEATQSASEIIQCWAKEYFRTEGRGKGTDYWEGTPTALIQEMSTDRSMDALIRTVSNPVAMGRYLAKLVNRGEPGIRKLRVRFSRAYRISKTIVPDEGKKEIDWS